MPRRVQPPREQPGAVVESTAWLVVVRTPFAKGVHIVMRKGQLYARYDRISVSIVRSPETTPNPPELAPVNTRMFVFVAIRHHDNEWKIATTVNVR